MLAIIDYDAGNIKSVEKAFEKLGQKVEITRSPEKILKADRIVLPGVGNFGDAMGRLDSYGLTSVIRQAAEEQIPVLGICLGLQLFFEGSEESGGIPGIGLLKGKCLRFSERPGYKIPQVGWNSLHLQHMGRLFYGIPEGAYVYFVHSFYAKAEDERCVKATCDYANVVDASVESGNVFACQFHPEKSGDVGLHILNNFLQISRGGKKPC